MVAVRESVPWLQGPRTWLLREGEARVRLFPGFFGGRGMGRRRAELLSEQVQVAEGENGLV